MKNFLKYFFIAITFFLLGALSYRLYSNIPREVKKAIPIINPKPLLKYSIENLSKAEIKPAKLAFDYENHKFTMEFEPALDGQVKKVSGRLTMPENPIPNAPLVIMIRGYVDKEIFQSGVGTRRAADFFTKNGFVTYAPDFLGYGESDPESTNVLETRFQTYVTILSLTKALEANGQKIAIWAHSNGGQIALTALEITGKNYPTILWAPVSKSFPYSILYYTDELPDLGKYLRGEIAKFEKDYDVDDFSIHKYYDRITAPINLHQGTADDAIPVEWSNDLAKHLNLNLNLNFFLYSGADHNLNPAWNTVVARDLQFLLQYTHDYTKE